ncbi:MAG: cell division protein ZapA [Lachnospiraceae bacterium]|nr:cell division protein ZapA [Lachnospiraceae bacterium]
MSQLTETQVVVGGKVIKVSGYESSEYHQKLASYINNMISEFEKQDGYRLRSSDLRALMIQLNLADEYFKAQERCEKLEEQVKERDKAIYDLRHDVVKIQMELDNTIKENKELRSKKKNDGK